MINNYVKHKRLWSKRNESGIFIKRWWYWKGVVFSASIIQPNNRLECVVPPIRQLEWFHQAEEVRICDQKWWGISWQRHASHKFSDALKSDRTWMSCPAISTLFTGSGSYYPAKLFERQNFSFKWWCQNHLIQYFTSKNKKFYESCIVRKIATGVVT